MPTRVGRRPFRPHRGTMNCHGEPACATHSAGAPVGDTPGQLTLPAHGDEERIAARLLLEEPVRAVVHVGDAKNLRRTLLLTVQLAEMGLPLVLALNMMDEAEARGVILNQPVLVGRP